jgi:hypothetical protein
LVESQQALVESVANADESHVTVVESVVVAGVLVSPPPHEVNTTIERMPTIFFIFFLFKV